MSRAMLPAMEPDEISEFAAKMREAGEASLTRASLIISLLAVLVALVTVFSHREHTEAVLSQARASDRWAEYQGRRTRQAELDLVTATLPLLPGATAEARQEVSAPLAVQRARLQGELKDDAAEARALEGEVVVAERRATRLDMGEALLQISVVLASITLLTRRWRYVLGALGLGILGLIAALSALLTH